MTTSRGLARFFRTPQILGGMFFGAVLATPGFAGDAGSTAMSHQVMEEVVVRAQRRAEDLVDVPVQVTVLSAEDLIRDDILTLEDLDANVPNAFFGGSQNYGGATMAIRGIGGSATVFGDEPVAMFIDDQYIPRNSNGSQSLLDLESIEVLRGPQVTLYGRNATGGAILLRSVRPDLDSSNGYFRTRQAQFGDQRYEVAYGTPVGDNRVAVRVAGIVNKRDGWATNTATGESLDNFDSVRGRVSLLWEPDDETTVFAVLESGSSESRVANARFAIDTDNSVRIPQSSIDALHDGIFTNDSPNFSDLSDQRAVISVERQFENFKLTVDAGYSAGDVVGATDSDGTGASLFDNVGAFESETFTQNISLISSGDGKFEWIVGASAVQDTFDMNFFFIRNYAVNGDFRFFSSLKTNAYAAYAEGTYALTDRLSITGGLRGSWEEKEVNVDSLFLVGTTGALLADPPLFADQESWSAYKPRVILEYALADSTNLYASVSTGFKSGGYNAFGQVPAYDDEGIVAYELGFKGRYLDGRLELSSAAFTYDYEDLQLRLGVPTGGVSITNAASAKITGFEAEWRLDATENIRIFGSVALLDAKFNEFITRDLAQNLVNAAGNRLARAPETQFTLGAAFYYPVGDSLLLSLNGLVKNRDEVFFRETNQDAFAWHGDALTEVDLSLSIATTNDRWEVTAFVQNATDQFVSVGASAAGDFPLATFSEPRKYGVSLTVNF